MFSYQDLYLFIKGSALPFSWNVIPQDDSWLLLKFIQASAQTPKTNLPPPLNFPP